MRVFANGMATGVVLGMGLVLLAPALLPVLVRGSRPALKAVVRSGVGVYERGRETFAEVAEELEDMVAEVRAEMFEEQAPDQSQAEEAPDSEEPVAEPPPPPGRGNGARERRGHASETDR